MINSTMTTMRSCGAGLLAAAMLSFPLVAGAKGAPLVVDRAASHVDVAVTSTVTSFVARLEKFDAALTLDPESGRVESAAFHADLAAVKTGRADRDHNMVVWLQTNQFPQVDFALIAVDRDPSGTLTAHGQFQLHGQQRELRFPITVTLSHGLTTIDGTAALDTRDFGLPIIRFWLLTVDPVVHVHFHLQGSLGR